MQDSECKHLNFLLRNNDPIGKAYCPDCHELVWLSTAFNNLAAEMRKVLWDYAKAP